MIDAASFTTIRVVSGAIALLGISMASRTLDVKNSLTPDLEGPRSPDIKVGPTWRSAVALSVYAIAFSFAYLSLTTGTGALILFGAVQTTMLAAALLTGERPRLLEWVGLVSALAGLIVLVFPGLTAPPLVGSVLMAIAGISWGFYSLWGRGTKNPLAATTVNFVRAVPLAVVVSVAMVVRAHVTTSGAMLAASSGALTSGVGYVIWYAALRGLTATRAATVQLAVPVLAAVGGVAFLSEQITARLFIAALMILGGIGLAILGRRR